MNGRYDEKARAGRAAALEAAAVAVIATQLSRAAAAWLGLSAAEIATGAVLIDALAETLVHYAAELAGAAIGAGYAWWRGYRRVYRAAANAPEP
jgi:hypothetical protein